MYHLLLLQVWNRREIQDNFIFPGEILHETCANLYHRICYYVNSLIIL